MPFALEALRLLPRNAVSRAAGRFAALRLPRACVRAEIALFARAAGVNLAEVRDPLDSFASLQDFFVRALRDGARPVAPEPDALVAPCDGAWGESGSVESGRLLQVKGRPYGLAELLASQADAQEFEGGAFATFYLAPRDYHRFHAPCDARVESARYVPGTLWPVNRIGLDGVDGLFAQNERIAVRMRAGPGNALLCVVAVGATLVGKVRVGFDASLTTNLPGARGEARSYAPPVELAKGQEWGRFEFGSTLVLLAARGAVELEPRTPGAPLRLGTRVGRLARV
ncbi:MAG TPA: archaetidylserine decarboxylase [Myxococcota bacterium]|nr:archaetidylserine decarboxylase [Myxococcota bacterium]